MRKTIGLILGVCLVGGLMLVSLAQAAPGGGGFTPSAWVYLPFVALDPTSTPTNTPTATVTPTATPTGNPSSVTGFLELSNFESACNTGSKVCVREVITNTSGSTVYYSFLGVAMDNLTGPDPSDNYHESWTGDLAIDPFCVGPTDRCGGPWNDTWNISPAGTYNLSLTVCFSAYAACLQPGGDWRTLYTISNVGITGLNQPDVRTPVFTGTCRLVTDDPRGLYLDCAD